MLYRQDCGVTVVTSLGPSGLDIAVSGWVDTAMCCTRGITVAYEDITSVRTTEWAPVRAEMGWRVKGGYVPGRIATGWYAIPRRKGARQFWAVFSDRTQLAVIETRLERPARLVLAVADAEAFVAALRPLLPTG